MSIPACYALAGWLAGQLEGMVIAHLHLQLQAAQAAPNQHTRDELAMQTRTARQLHACLPMHVMAEDSAAMQGGCDCAGTIILRLCRAPNGEWIKTHQGDRDAG